MRTKWKIFSVMWKCNSFILLSHLRMAFICYPGLFVTGEPILKDDLYTTHHSRTFISHSMTNEVCKNFSSPPYTILHPLSMHPLTSCKCHPPLTFSLPLLSFRSCLSPLRNSRIISQAMHYSACSGLVF